MHLFPSFAAAVLLLVPAPPAPAQVSSGPGAGAGASTNGGGGVFKGDFIGGGGGGSGSLPGDASGPGGNDNDDGGANGDDNGNKAGPPATNPGAIGPPATPGASGGAVRAGGQTSGAGRNRAGGATTGAVDTLPDRWEAWWESNKFDFVELVRVQDAAPTQQGSRRETPAEREERLADVRARIRSEILPLMRGLSASDDPAVRASSVVSLGKLRDREAYAAMTPLLGDPSYLVRRSAMLGLGLVDDGRAAYMLLNIANDTPAGRALIGTNAISGDDRGIALIALTLRGDDRGAELVGAMLDERDTLDDVLLALTCDAAGLMGSPIVLDELIEIAQGERRPQYVRSAATSALGRIGDPSVTPVLVELLDGALEPRRAAAVALGEIAHSGSAHVIERLGEMLAHEKDAPARHFAAMSLGRIGGSIARATLEEAFEDANADMRPWLALALGVAERSTPTGTLVPLLARRLARESNVETRGAYLIALGLARDEQALELLTEVLEDNNQELGGKAAMALGLCGQASAAPSLRAALARATSPDLLRQAAFALGLLADTRSIGDLTELIRTTSNPFVASFAALGIALMGDEQAAGPLLHIIEREGPRGVTATWAAASVGQLFDSDRRPALSRLAAGDNFHARTAPVSDLLDLGF